MSQRPKANALVLAAALLIAAGPYMSRAYGRAPEGPTTANVDINQVYAESDARAKADAKTGAYGRALGGKFDEIAGLQYLTPQEIKDLSDAMLPASPTAAETQKATALKAESAKRLAEYQKLSGKKDNELTDADRNRLRELNAMQQQQGSAMVQLQRLYQQLVNEEDLKNTRAGMAEVRTVVASVAKGQGVTQVFDASSLIYAPADLTAAAIAKVKKK